MFGIKSDGAESCIKGARHSNDDMRHRRVRIDGERKGTGGQRAYGGWRVGLLGRQRRAVEALWIAYGTEEEATRARAAILEALKGAIVISEGGDAQDPAQGLS